MRSRIRGIQCFCKVTQHFNPFI
uniref:Uncharacterized protein n=1 Tax=Anguilla anguilla TaxID=7936 RepID=A0A0E9RQ05_ANGAN